MCGFFFFIFTRVKSSLPFYGFEPLSWTLFPGLDHLLNSRSLCSNYSAINSSVLYPVSCSEKKTQPLPEHYPALPFLLGGSLCSWKPLSQPAGSQSSGSHWCTAWQGEHPSHKSAHTPLDMPRTGWCDLPGAQADKRSWVWPKRANPFLLHVRQGKARQAPPRSALLPSLPTPHNPWKENKAPGER